jgi:signal transduction histidine kinase/DNA-binding response OmpR family regulator
MGLPQKWPDLSLRAKCLLLIAFPAAGMISMCCLTFILAARNSTASAGVERSLETAQELQRLRAAEAEARADVGAYLITAQESFVSRARASFAAVDSARQQLLNLTADSPLEQRRVAQIASVEHSEHSQEERMFGDLARFRLGAWPLDELRAGVNGVQTQRSRMENLLKSIEQDNARQLETASRRASELRVQQGAITEICAVFGLLGGVAIAILWARGITGRMDRLQRNLARLGSGAIPDPVAGRDEIGTLNLGLIQVAEMLRRKGLALENALDGIAEVDADGRYLWLNKAYADMTGCSQNFRPPGIADTVQPEDRAGVHDAIAQMRLQGRSEIAARIVQPQGRSHVSVTFLATAEDPNSSFYVFLRDLGAGKRGDAALIRAKDAAVASNRAKTEFLAKISHDIRTPLNAILGSADLLSGTPLSFDQAEYINMFQRNCRRLVALINDFLDFSRIEAGAVRVEKAPFQIRDTVGDAVATFREAAARKGVELGLEIDSAAPEWALGDPLRIQQVLVNLLSNALKFTDAGRVDVNVRALSSATARDQLRFEVCDTGPGMRLEDQDKIFAQFVQLPNQSSRQHGVGLGLAICRDLVELMEGEIGVVSREGSGSTFHFSLPLEAVEPVLAASDTFEPNAFKRQRPQLPRSETIRILVAEDTEDNRVLLEHYLRGEPVELRFAQNGQEALDAIQQGEQFDLILMDIDMPVMDGYTATRRIRAWQQALGAEAQNLAAPIVALSADAMREAVRASLEAGCVAHVAKPVDRDTLLKTIHRFAAPAAGTLAAQDAPAQAAITVSEQVLALVPQYLASKKTQIEEARMALASRDFAPIRRFGHNLKGTGRGYGFPPIEDIGTEIERAAAEADPSRIADQLDALHRFVTESAGAIAPLSAGKAF